MGLYEEKLLDRFAAFDRDGDGYLTEADFTDVAEGIVTAYGLEESSDKAGAMAEGARRYFAGLAGFADADGDGRISTQEFTGVAKSRLRDDSDGFREIVLPWAQALIAVADVDGDGRVDVGEWQRMLRVLGATPEGVERATGIDADGDGFVTSDELVETLRRFYTSDTPMPGFAARH